MKLLLKTIIVLSILVGGGYVGYRYLLAFFHVGGPPNWREAPVTVGEVVAVVNATGTVQPVLRVQVGSFASGPILELGTDEGKPGTTIDFNSKVKKGQLLARIDPQLYDANQKRDEAALATRKAEVKRSKAQLRQAENDEKRAKDLYAENKEYISETEMDQFKYNRLSLEAQLEVAEAAVKQAEANLEQSKTNVGYTKITSPVDGIVIDRKIDPGQTLVAQFQTPELFVVAPDLEKKVRVFASVDEADIGMIREAQRRKQRVQFTVDAYPDDLFEGEIFQIRMNPTSVQNVVTYPVVVETSNPELKLLPGMTANLSFQIDRRDNVLRIPNAALRFYPKLEHVRPEDRHLLEGVQESLNPEAEMAQEAEKSSAQQRADAKRKRHRRHVWVRQDDHLLRAVEVVTGLADNKFTELVSGPLEKGQMLVTFLSTAPAEKPGEKSGEKPAEESAEQPGQKPAEKAAEKPAEKPVAKPAVRPAGQPSSKPPGGPDDEPAVKRVRRPGRMGKAAATGPGPALQDKDCLERAKPWAFC
jgi:HlyD family secretion protein